MKSFLFFCLVMGMTVLCAAQNECKSYFSFHNNTSMEYTSYDKKGAAQFYARHKVIKVENTPAGVEATVETQTTDHKGNNPMSGQFKARCKDNTLIMDVSSLLGPQATSAFSNLEVSTTGDDLLLPSALEVGQTLPDASTQIKAASGGVSLITMTVNIRNRKVEAKETIQTTAGSFECYRISYTTETRMLGAKSIDTKVWYAEGVGMVRQESYDKKGNLEGKIELTKFEKGK